MNYSRTLPSVRVLPGVDKPRLLVALAVRTLALWLMSASSSLLLSVSPLSPPCVAAVC